MKCFFFFFLLIFLEKRSDCYFSPFMNTNVLYVYFPLAIHKSRLGIMIPLKDVSKIIKRVAEKT